VTGVQTCALPIFIFHCVTTSCNMSRCRPTMLLSVVGLLVLCVFLSPTAVDAGHSPNVSREKTGDKSELIGLLKKLRERLNNAEVGDISHRISLSR